MSDREVYAISSFVLSGLSTVLASWYLYKITQAYHRYHDERAAVSLIKALGLWVIAIGTAISALGLLLAHGPLSSVGLSVARGALLVTLATLVLANVRPHGSHADTVQSPREEGESK